MADIFLSYATEDRETAEQIAHHLAAGGWTVWWDRKIPAGMTWRQVIENALNEMRCMVVLWSTSSITSAWVNEEAEEGRTRDKLVPVFIEPVVPPLGFRGIQAADLAGWNGSASAPGFLQLLADLEMRLGRPSRQPAAVGETPARAATGAGTSNAPRYVLAAVAVAATVVIAWVWHDTNEDAGKAAQPTPVNASVTPPTQTAPVVPLAPNPSPTAPALPETPVRPLHPPTATTGTTDPTVKPRVPAVAVETTASKRSIRPEKEPVARAVRPARCRDILERQGLGDPLTAEDRVFLQKECRS